MRTLRTLLCAVTVGAMLVACGGGGTRDFEDEDSSTPDAPAASVASVKLMTSAPSVPSDGGKALRLFATVKDSGNLLLEGVPVSFGASGTGVTVTVVRALTDANGQAEAALTVDDPVNRTITVSARAENETASADVEVVGTTASISGPASVVVNTAAVFQVVVKDASGSPVAGKAVEAESSAGSQVTVSPSLTNSQGMVDLILTPVKVGTDTLTVTAAGATGVASVQVSSTSVAFDAPPEASEIVVSSPAVPVRVQVLENGVPVVGTTVMFTATRGALGAASGITDPNGYATTTIASPLAGRSLITATAPNGTVATRDVRFVADRAAKIEVQASPSTVGVTLPGATPDSSQIIAVVRDAVDNPVKAARVNFSAVDPSAGPGLSQSFALTDEFGRATVTFYPGVIPTGADQIVVTGAIDCTYAVTGVQCLEPGAPPMDQVTLTAARRALQVRIGTGNELRKIQEGDAAPVFNELPYGVLVTDSAGNPVSGVMLSATVVGVDYGKGLWINPCAPDKACWQQVNANSSDNSIPAWCPGEDLNENLLLDTIPFNEDRNGDGVLTPGNVASAYFGPTGSATTGSTDDKGSDVLRIRYLRDRSSWVTVRVRVSASIPNGTEGAETVEFRLPMLAEDISSATVSPPGAVSPYRTGNCP